ncbi:MAG: cysteine-rich VLP domain-containing protein [Lachnospiraceae bacterium]|nr:cysteine-rich VLP domain-containing protein [Lachnospiraceae bacterium]
MERGSRYGPPVERKPDGTLYEMTPDQQREAAKLIQKNCCNYEKGNCIMQIRTNDPKLIRRLAALSEEYPDLCRYIGKDEICGSYFEVDKKLISIHVTRPYSDECRRKQSEFLVHHLPKLTNGISTIF